MSEQERKAGHHEIQRLLDIMARLRDPEQGCEWDELKADMLEVAKDIALDPKTSNAWNNRKL